MEGERTSGLFDGTIQLNRFRRAQCNDKTYECERKRLLHISQAAASPPGFLESKLKS